MMFKKLKFVFYNLGNGNSREIQGRFEEHPL